MQYSGIHYLTKDYLYMINLVFIVKIYDYKYWNICGIIPYKLGAIQTEDMNVTYFD
jgi:hypothetical protein